MVPAELCARSLPRTSWRSSLRHPIHTIKSVPHSRIPTPRYFLLRGASTRAHAIGKDIPSRPFARFLGNLMIAEPIDDDTDCRIRLAGSSLRQRYKREVSGRRLSELFSPVIAADNLARLRKVREMGRAFIHTAAVMPDDTPPLHYEVLLLHALAPNEAAMWNVIGIFTFAS